MLLLDYRNLFIFNQFIIRNLLFSINSQSKIIRAHIDFDHLSWSDVTSKIITLIWKMLLKIKLDILKRFVYRLKATLILLCH